MTKLRVCVVFGGASSEHEVSLMSSTSILRNIDRELFDVFPVGITRDGKWYYYDGPIGGIESGEWEKSGSVTPCAILPDRSRQGITLLDGDFATLPIDVIFPVLHGKNGEDGTIQGLFELAGIPYVGCGVLSSAAGMDKTFTKLVAAAAGVNQAKWLPFSALDWRRSNEKVISAVENRFEYPVFVKPANTGSSVGISKAKSREALVRAITEALRYDSKFLVEETIVGRELETAALGNVSDGGVEIACVGEVLPSREFYTYESKYTDGTTKTVVPAELTQEESAGVRDAALRVYEALDCKGLARVDFFIRSSDGAVIFNEINTMPGFTSISMYPKLFEAVGISYGELITRLIRLAAGERANG